MSAPALDRTDLLERCDAVVAELADLAAGNDARAEIDPRSLALVHGAGLLTATVSRTHGGPGLGHHGVHELLRRLGRADPAVALVVAMTLALHQQEARAPRLDPAFYGRILAESRERPTLLNALQVEPALGTPSRGGRPATTAVREGDGWRLTGHKIYSTGAPHLRWMLVLATTDEPRPRVGTFAVDASAPGIEIRPTWSSLGMRATRSDDVVFTGTPVAGSAVSGLAPADDRPKAHPGPGTGIPSIYLGVAEAARTWLVRFVRERVPTNLGHPLAELPRIQDAIGEITVALTGARELLSALAAQADAGREIPRDTAWSAKTLATRAAIGAVEKAVALIGNPGLSGTNPLERHLRDVLAARVHFPQEDTVVATLGREAVANRDDHS
ncbi:acyl-CoA dehydrogenase family protein [Pseudonocardia ailaonensis]|uniref:Acyl-CoA dehydrogenase family protein n=1 Tax=Pseudonocardia ailaonensis TaxID=367279 RepID=A0ABN2N5I6_9PSEU